MNFLAHTLFADNDELIVVGQYCGDFVRGGNLEQFPAGIREGIRRHRRIDTFTDQHPVNLRARNFFEKPLRRFAGIITDVVYDHYLARNWSLYSDQSLENHAAFVYAALAKHKSLMPPDLQRFSEVVIQRDMLVAYREFDAVEMALGRIANRSSRFQVLATAAGITRELDEPLSACFAEFAPELIEHVASIIED